MQVMVVDMNEGFTRKGNLYSPRVGALVEPMVEFLSSLSEKDRVVFITDCHKISDSELQRFPPHCIEGSGEELVRKELLNACYNSYVPSLLYEKDQYDVFLCGHEDKIINPYDNNWVVIGCVTDICVEATVAGLVMRDQNVTVVRNLIDTFDIPGHNADEINKFWFEQRFPNVWGAKVVEDWKELV